MTATSGEVVDSIVQYGVSGLDGLLVRSNGAMGNAPSSGALGGGLKIDFAAPCSDLTKRRGQCDRDGSRETVGSKGRAGGWGRGFVYMFTGKLRSCSRAVCKVQLAPLSIQNRELGNEASR